MGVKLTKVPKLNPEDLTERETLLWQIIRELQEKVRELTDEIARLKGEKEKPKIKPSLLEPKEKNSSPQEDEASETSGEKTSDSQEKKKRPGSAKRKKTPELTIHENKVIEPIEEIPPGSEFKGYQDYTVQELLIKPHNMRYRLARWKTPTGEYLRGKLPEEVVKMGHFGSILKSYLRISLSSLPCHSTQTPDNDGRLGHRYLHWAVKPNFSRRQRTISHRKARDIKSWRFVYRATSTQMILGPATKGSIAIAHILVMNGLHGLKRHLVRIASTFLNSYEGTEVITFLAMKL